MSDRLLWKLLALLVVSASACPGTGAQGFLPPAGPEPPSGANPFQGLGRADDSGPNRTAPSTVPDAPPADAQDGSPSTDSAADPGSTTGSSTDQKPAEDKSDNEDAEQADKPDDEQNEIAPLQQSALPYDPLREALFDFSSKQYDKCLSTLNRVLTNNPKYPQAHYLRGVVYVMLRQYANAAAEYKAVMQLVPNSELGLRASEGLKKIRF